MGLSSDPEKRQRQLDALALGRGLHEDPVKRRAQLDALAGGRAKRHGNQPDEPAPPTAAAPVRKRRSVPARYEESPPDEPAATEAPAREAEEPADDGGDEPAGPGWLERLVS